MIPQLQQESPASATETVAHWSLPLRIAFRFSFAYFLLYIYPDALGSLSQDAKNNGLVAEMWHAVVPWVGTHVLKLSGDFREVSNGSGDLLFDWVLLFCIAVVAALTTVIWSVLDRKRPNYQKLYAWLRIMMRLAIAVGMIGYGSNKLFRTQFPAPTLVRLLTPYGETSPMDLLWTFMGFSRAYSFFGGVGEMLGGILVLIPGLTALGSLITAAVMTNVLMLNLAYDVPRKIYSIHLVLLCIFLLIPDMRRLLDFFVLNRSAQLSKPMPVFQDRILNRALSALLVVVVVGLLVTHLRYSHDAAAKAAQYLPAPVRGVWNVDEFILDGAVRPAMATDPQRWRRLVLDKTDWLGVQPMEGLAEPYYSEVDTTKRIITVWKPGGENRKDTLVYQFDGPERMTVEGVVNGHSINAKLTRLPLSDQAVFELPNRGFHWVSSRMDWRGQY